MKSEKRIMMSLMRDFTFSLKRYARLFFMLYRFSRSRLRGMEFA